jgi:hypothetical protein
MSADATQSKRRHRGFMRDGIYTQDAAGPAMRTKIASFHGGAFVAEREGEDLSIYHIGSDPIPTSTAGDRRAPAPKDRMTSARLAEVHRQSREAEKARAAELRP